MAYSLHWQVKFKNHLGQVLIANIYDEATVHLNWPIQLIPAAVPFETQEDDTEDIFTPVRLQSGYLRIVDTGQAKDANNATVSFDWHDILPTYATARPVVLTDDRFIILWQGFIQVQNFGGTLMLNPQEREFPLQCVLTTAEGFDVDYQHTQIENFAYLLYEILTCVGTPAISKVHLSGGSASTDILRKKIDWQHFVAAGDYALKARYNLLECLEDFCKFWGFTARTWRDEVFLTCYDDADFTGLNVLTIAQLQQIAQGSVVSVAESVNTTPIPSNRFLSMENVEYQFRGAQKAIIQADGDTAEPEVIYFAPDKVVTDMKNNGWSTIDSGQVDGKYVWRQYTNGLQTFSSPLMNGTARTNNGSFAIRSDWAADSEPNDSDMKAVLRITHIYGDTRAKIQLTSVYQHAFSDGLFSFKGVAWQGFKQYINAVKGTPLGKKTMFMRLGVGPSRDSSDTKWYNGGAWVTGTPSDFRVTIGNEDDKLRTVQIRQVGNGESRLYNEYIPMTNVVLTGYVFIEFMGSDDLGDNDNSNDYTFDIADFSFVFERNLTYQIGNPNGNQFGGAAKVREVKRAGVREYTAENNNRSRMNFNADCIYASDNNMDWGYGLVLNADGSYMGGFSFDGQTTETPEQHLADRVANYWRIGRQKLVINIGRTNVIKNYGCDMKMTYGGKYFWPISYRDNYRDCSRIITLMELDS